MEVTSAKPKGFFACIAACVFSGLLLVTTPPVAADVSVPNGTWYYQQRGELLDTETFSDTINPMQFPSYSEDKTITYPPFQFYQGGEIQTLTSTIFGGGMYPALDSQLETDWNNVPFTPGRDASVSAGMSYKFQAWKKFAWAPEWDVPIAAFMSVDVSAHGPHQFFQPRPASASASADISYRSSTGTFTIGITANTIDDGNTSKQLFKKFAISLDTINDATLSTNIVASSGGNYLTGNWGGQAFADPAIQIDPDAFILVNGTNYRASDLYGLSFSPGFEAVPEPNLGQCFWLLLPIVATMIRYRPIT